MLDALITHSRDHRHVVCRLVDLMGKLSLVASVIMSCTLQDALDGEYTIIMHRFLSKEVLDLIYATLPSSDDSGQDLCVLHLPGIRHRLCH
jgi:hypothetical protein